MKIGETIGKTTQGYGKSRIKWYGNEENWEMVLLCNDKNCGRLLFDSLEQMAEIKKILGENFRIVPK